MVLLAATPEGHQGRPLHGLRRRDQASGETLSVCIAGLRFWSGGGQPRNGDRSIDPSDTGPASATHR